MVAIFVFSMAEHARETNFKISGCLICNNFNYMKAVLILFPFLLLCIAGHGQEYDHVDSRMLDIPAALTYSTDSIAKFINKHFSNDEEKIRAAYTWVATNIRYDTDSMYSINADRDPSARIRIALARRRGVCENYAAIFNDIASKCGIRTQIISGYTKQYGSIDKTGHTWCAAFLDHEWYLFDPTWDEGRYSKRGYNWFMKLPADFISSHMPFDPLWQLLDKPISHEAFYSGRLQSKISTPYHFKDSVEKFFKLSQVQQLESAIERIQRMGIANELVKNNLTYVQMQAGIIHEGEGMEFYNTAVKYFNNANDNYNRFIRFRNNQFTPPINDEALRDFLKPSFAGIDSARTAIELLEQNPANEQYSPDMLRSRLTTLARKAKEQQTFIEKYLSTEPGLRKTLFY